MCHKKTLNVPENNLIKELLLFKLDNPSKGNQYSLANSEPAKPNFAGKRTPLDLQTQQISEHHTASVKIFKRKHSYFFESQTNKAHGIKEKYMFLLQSSSRNSLSPKYPTYYKYLCSKYHINFCHSEKFG
jgi:hypothetical protein